MFYSFVIEHRTSGEIDRIYGETYKEAMMDNLLDPADYCLISVHEEPDCFEFQDDDGICESEYDNCDDDFGFDPYLGCYTDDC